MYVRCHNTAGEICIMFGCDPPGHAHVHVPGKVKQRWVDGLTRFDKTGQLSLRSEGGYKTFTWGWNLLTHQSEHNVSVCLICTHAQAVWCGCSLDGRKSEYSLWITARQW